MQGFLAFLILLLLLPRVALSQDTLSDDELMDLIQEKSLRYFLYEADARTGLVKDRAHNFKRGALQSESSIAATGFALTAYVVGVERGWLDRAQAEERTLRTLQFFLNYGASEHGFFYHFLDPSTGERARRSELSPIDTALFLAGALFAAEYYEDPQIRDLAQQIYERVDWPWMMHNGETLAMAWSPESGFDRNRWDHYDESMIMYLLAIGSPTHPIPPDTWQKITRRVGSYGNYRLIQMPPLFTHQYSHIWIDFKNKNDGYADYFLNSVNATLANREFCMDQSSKFKTYGPDSWGLTAADGPFGYKAYGAPPGWAAHDGTVAPTGCISSIVFTPEESLACMRHLYEMHADRMWGEYGFSDSFNLDRDWYASDVIGIDQGAMLLMIENYRTGLIWNVMSRNENLKNAMRLAGFKDGSIPVPWPDPPVYDAPFLPNGLKIDGYLKDWPVAENISLTSADREAGTVTDDKDLKGSVRFAWSREALYFSVNVTDDSVILKRTGHQLWRDDALELFIDPQGDGLYWNDSSDYQIGFRASFEDDQIQTWSWFQGGEDPAEKGMVAARGFADQEGYIIEGAVRWRYLGIDPVDVGDLIREIRLSLAVHDLDQDKSEGKLQWFFRNEEAPQRYNLGRLVLKP